VQGFLLGGRTVTKVEVWYTQLRAWEPHSQVT
jgi:hypothetical protein